jgi:hypothetical protein
VRYQKWVCGWRGFDDCAFGSGACQTTVLSKLQTTAIAVIGISNTESSWRVAAAASRLHVALSSQKAVLLRCRDSTVFKAWTIFVGMHGVSNLRPLTLLFRSTASTIPEDGKLRNLGGGLAAGGKRTAKPIPNVARHMNDLLRARESNSPNKSEI